MQAAILHRDHLLDLDDAGFRVDFHVSHAHAANAAVGEVGWLALVGILAANRQRHRAQLGAGLFPAQRAAGIAFHPHRAIHRFQFFRLAR